MRLVKSGGLLVALIGTFLSSSVFAQTAAETSSQCAATFEQCQAQCTIEHENDNIRRAPCMTVCSGQYAACDAGVVYDTAKPWVDDKIEKSKPWFEEQADKAKSLFDDLMKEYGSDNELENPQKKTKDNSI